MEMRLCMLMSGNQAQLGLLPGWMATVGTVVRTNGRGWKVTIAYGDNHLPQISDFRTPPGGVDAS